LRRSLANLRQRGADPAKRLKTNQDRQCIDGDHAEAEDRQIEKEASLKAGDLIFKFRAVAHHPKAGHPVCVVENELALEDFERLSGNAVGYVVALETRVE